MNTPDPQSGQRPAAFDDHARALHRQSLDQLPSQLHARLRTARREALAARGSRAHPPRWLPAGLATTLVLAVVAAIGLQGLPGDASGDIAEPVFVRSPPAAPAPLAESDPELALILDSLEHTPDFYLWLASNDDAMPPMEH